jgi:hypothetical protein
MQFPPISFHFFPPRSKYSPQHPVLKHPPSTLMLLKCAKRVEHVLFAEVVANAGM